MSQAAPCGIILPPRFIPIINAKRSGMDANPQVVVNVSITGMNTRAVGVFATNPDMKLTMMRIKMGNTNGFIVLNGMSSKIS